MVNAFSLRRAGTTGKTAGLLLAVVAVTVVAATGTPTASAAISSESVVSSVTSATAQPHWTSARLLPGVGGDWSVPFSVDCTGPGDCTVGGEYGPDEPYTQSMPFVTTETGGKWGSAQTVAGIPGLDSNQYAAVTSVSCAWPGNCAAVGYYLPKQTPNVAFTGQAFVLDEVNGTWQPMRPLAGVTQGETVNALGPDWILTVSCAPAATRAARAAGLNCLVVGGDISAGRTHGFVAQAKHGAWGAAQLVTGLSRLDGTRPSQVTTVSCTASGSCAVGGSYTDGQGRRQAFVASEVKGRWRDALEVPGTGALNVKGSAEVDAVDCPVAGNCTAAGDYRTESGAAEFFVIYQTAGTWRSATELPGVARLGTGAAFVDNGFGVGAGLVDVACAPGACAVGGAMTAKGGGSVGFLVGEAGGRWSAPHPVPGTDSAVTALSCPAAGECAAGGTVQTADEISSGIVLDQVNGAWGKPVTVDLAPADSPASSEITALSCAAARSCAAAGDLPEGDEAGPVATVATEEP
jgi:hypothetical protein